jgi:hypothetical protein
MKEARGIFFNIPQVNIKYFYEKIF